MCPSDPASQPIPAALSLPPGAAAAAEPPHIFSISIDLHSITGLKEDHGTIYLRYTYPQVATRPPPHTGCLPIGTCTGGPSDLRSPRRDEKCRARPPPQVLGTSKPFCTNTVRCALCQSARLF